MSCTDETAEYDVGRWRAPAAAGAPYTRPMLDLDAASARAFVDPRGWLGQLEGRRVLCLAGGGGRGAGLGGKRVYAPGTVYPAITGAAGAQGPVSVKVTVDEEGNVVAAEAVSGHPLLQPAAVGAARESKFKPTLVEGRPVEVCGVISYAFTLE